ncbi:PH domain-containing protein [Flavobacterium selenitireducens]|uniref:PH domain-containing protein n=1 Tax=Flavobacterium selenitireducens TaxID=2722704 RepID=UPI00168BF42D|nr:PH domain-containing protein [Flavobacterium selenitireducens]MBD3581957.1 hypothetical protein [Flavobacterium selenitireducens]
MRKYRASLDTSAKIITISIVVLFAVIVAGIWADYKTGDALGPYLYPTCFLPAILVAAYSFAPSGYSLGDKGIAIHRVWENGLIPYDVIESVSRIDKVASKGLIRTMGNGGLFGYYGYFSNREWGAMTWYLTRRRNLLVIKTNTSRFLLSPDDLEDFEAALQLRLNRNELSV